MSFLMTVLLILNASNQFPANPVQVRLSPAESSVQVVEYLDHWTDEEDLLIIQKQVFWQDRTEDGGSLETTATFIASWTIHSGTGEAVENLNLSVEGVHSSVQEPEWNGFYTLDLTGAYPSKALHVQAYGTIEIRNGTRLQSRTGPKTVRIDWNILR